MCFLVSKTDGTVICGNIEMDHVFVFVFAFTEFVDLAKDISRVI